MYSDKYNRNLPNSQQYIELKKIQVKIIIDNN